jgi:hypothetical protein
MGIKQPTHVFNKMAPTLYGNDMTLKHVKCGKGEKVCVLLTNSWVEVFVYEKVSKINSMWKDVKLKSCIKHIVYC